MENQTLQIVIYGADDPCPSCIHSPSSKETKEWLEAAVQRKFPDQAITFRYVDIQSPENDLDKHYTEKIINDEYFYPLVVANEQVIGEGNPRLKEIFQYLEGFGFHSA